MKENNKIQFCFYCGSLLPRYKEGETKYCVYCGIKLNYNSQFQIENSEN